MAERVDKYGPLLDSYVTVSARLPAILGWDGPRRYLVLTQNPAELRPTGGFTGSYGIVTFDRGRLTEHSFRDIVLLDYPWDYPFIKPPTELANYLLGPKQSLAAGRRQLVARLPDERPGCDPPLRERVRRYEDRRGAGDHDVHDRRAAQGDRPDHGPRVPGDDRVR